ncbi:hypothetical protein ACS0TY_028569 [Phlomoides rotata]
MRNQCLRLLLLRRFTPSQPYISQVHHLRSFSSSLLHPRAPRVSTNPFPLHRRFTSSLEPAVEPPKPPSDQDAVVADIFAEFERSSADIKLILDDKGVVITHDLILSVLGSPDIDPDIALRVFYWVSENSSENLSSESYDLMLGILGGNGFVKETWHLLEIMKEKGYGVSNDTFSIISERFQNDGLNDDVEKLKELCDLDSFSFTGNYASEENAVEEEYCRVSDMIKREVWGEDLEKQLWELGEEFSSDLVTRVLGNLEMDPNKALIFFRWVQESGVFKHDQRSFNAMARVLGEEDHTEKFWRFANEMKSEGHEMERETYIHILGQFIKKEMIKDAVDLYEFAMNGEVKSSEEDCAFLLNEIVVSEELDMDLFSKVLGFFKANGNATTDAILDAVIKSLVSVGRMNEGNRILVALKEAGCVPSDPLRRKIALELSSSGKTELALEFMDTMVPSPDYLTWESLVLGFCSYGNLDEASNSLRKMVEKEGASCANHALEALVTTYCEKNEPLDAYKVVSDMVNDKGLTPRYTTYKRLTKGLLALNHFKEALDVMSMIKKQGHCPYFDPFVEYLSRAGSVKDAIEFVRAMTTSKRYPATSVFIRLFEGYFRAGRISEAQDFLSICPGSIKNHADVLNLFASTKSGETRGDDVAV